LTSKALRHQRFYCSPDTINGDVIEFSLAESLHMVGSLRLGKGEMITATDGRGKVYRVVIEQARRRQVLGRILNARTVAEPHPAITVFQGIIRPSNMEVALSRCVELGISALVPVVSEFSFGGLGPRRLERLRRIAAEAMKQSLGAYLARVDKPAAFEDALASSAGFDALLVAWEGEREGRLASAAASGDADDIALWIGPEGGFAEKEIEALLSMGAVTFSLGDHRLRAETAAIAAVAIIHGVTN
jgi:16S rRNA (uracil1498-N3)-methyltransferase